MIQSEVVKAAQNCEQISLLPSYNDLGLYRMYEIENAMSSSNRRKP